MRPSCIQLNRLRTLKPKTNQSTIRLLHSSTVSSSSTRPDQPLKSTASTVQKPTQSSSRIDKKQLRSIIELYHTAENFAPLDDHERLIEFIDDSLLFKKPPAPYAPPSSPSILLGTIRALPLNQPILRDGESEFELNPVVVPHRVRSGQRRWEMVKDALCGTAGSALGSDIGHEVGVVGSSFGSQARSDGNRLESSAKAGLEIVEENWEQIKQIERQT